MNSRQPLTLSAVLLSSWVVGACSTKPDSEERNQGTPSSGGAGENSGGSSTGGTAPNGEGGEGENASGGSNPGASISCATIDELAAIGEWEMEQQVLSPLLFGEGDDPSEEASCEILNPERGFFSFVDLRGSPNLAGVRASGKTLIYGKILLEDYREQDLDPALLTQLESAFESIRAAGLKVLPRFYYADDGTSPDASLSQVLTHISQLTPLLTQNSDVIAALHAGFVGAWGEWHASTNNLTEPSARKQILDALLAALPADRMVLARRPSHKEAAYGGPLTIDSAFQESSLARVGHLNDCFLASDTDMGTYQLAGEKDYALLDSAFVAVGGETCAVNPPRSECASGLAELALHHFSFLNADYHAAVLSSWESDGCFDQIACRLGYRLLLTSIEVQKRARAGEDLVVRIRLTNDGFGRVYNPRPLSISLLGSTEVSLPAVSLATPIDVRMIGPGQDATFCVSLSLPVSLTPGTYAVGIKLADPAATLAEDPRYALRLANAPWNADLGINETAITIELYD